MKKFKSIISMLLLISLLAVPAVFNGFASRSPDSLTDIYDPNRVANNNTRTAGKTYTVTATTATGVNKTFVLDTGDMENHVETLNATMIKPDDTIFKGIRMAYCPEGDAPSLHTQCVIIPDNTKNLIGIDLSGTLDFVIIPKSVKYFGGLCVRNDNCVILYEGSEAEWNNIQLHYYREEMQATITNATVLFNCNYYDVAAGKATAKPASTAETPAVSTVSGFTDVKSTDYCAEPVKWAVKQGITTGVTKTTFVPGDTCTQAQIITFIWRSEGSPEPSGTTPYNISPDKYYYKAANWAYGKGMIDDYFNPNGGCSRAMAMTYLYKLAGSPAVSHAGNTFWDVGQSDSAYDAIYWAVDAGITKGTTFDTFSPAKTCTRGQIVTFLHRALVG